MAVQLNRKRAAAMLIKHVTNSLQVDVRTAAKQEIIADFCDGKLTESEALILLRHLGDRR